MRYTVNYCGHFFLDDNDNFNCHEYASFMYARNILWDIIQSGIDEHAYLKDEEYDCCLHWDPKEKDFYWN